MSLIDFICGLKHADYRLSAVVTCKEHMKSSRTSYTRFGQYLAVSLLILGFGPRVLAQASSNGWSESISFSGTGTLPVSQTSYVIAGVPDPVLGITLAGTGLASAVDDGYGDGGYYVNNAIQTTVQNITLPGVLAPTTSPFSVTAPVSGTDPGLTLNTPQSLVYSAGGAPFYGLYPPTSGTKLTDIIATPVIETFQYGADVLLAAFGSGLHNSGDVSLILGTDTQTVGPGGVYTDSYAGTELEFSAAIGENDPEVVFTGDFIITTTVPPTGSVPDSSPGVVGILALLGVCAIGGWQKRAQAA